MSYMSDTISLRLPHELGERLDRLSAATSRSKSFYVRQLLELHLADLEYVAGLDVEVESLRRGEQPARPLADLTRELGFDPDELRAEAESTGAESSVSEA